MLHLVLSLSCQKQFPNMHVEGEIPQSRIGDPSSRLPTPTPVLAGARLTPKIRHGSGGLLRTGRLAGGPSSGRCPEVGHLERQLLKDHAADHGNSVVRFPCWQRAADRRFRHQWEF